MADSLARSPTSSGAPARRRWWISFALFVAIGTVWALSSPVMSIPDEPSHVIKAVATADGVLDGPLRIVHSTLHSRPSGTWTIYRETGLEAELGLSAHCYAYRPRIPAGCLDHLTADSQPALVETQVGQYPPLYYAWVGWPVHLGLSPNRMVLAMRMMAVLLGGALLASGLSSAIGGSFGPAAIAGAALATTPMVFFMVGAVNPSGMEITAAFCLWLSLLRLMHDDGPPGWHLLVRVAVSAALLAWTRPFSPAFVLCIGAAVLVAVARRSRLAELWSLTAVRVAIAATAVAGGLATTYILASGALNAFTGFPHPGLTTAAAAQHSFDKVPHLAQDMIGVFGWGDTHPPPWLTLGWLIAVGVLAVVALVVGSWRQRLAIVGTGVGILAIQVASEAIKAPAIGYVWQGRYSLPVAMGVPILSGWVVATSPRVERRIQVVLAALASVWVAIGLLSAHAVWMRRNMTGVAHPVLSYLTGHGWSPPLPAWVLGASMLVLALAYGVWLFVSSGSLGPTSLSLTRDEPPDG